MNTKGMKFLAVVAVMAMAFAAFAVFAPAEQQNEAASIVVYGNDNVVDVDPTYVTSGEEQLKKIYISDDATVKVKGAASAEITFYVQNGKTLELDVKEDQTVNFTIYTVTGDQEKATTSTDTEGGKHVLENTKFSFKAVKGQSIYYKASTGSYYVTYSGDGAFVGTWDESANAKVGADKEFNELPVIMSDVDIADGQTITVVAANVEIGNNFKGYGIFVKETSGTTTSGTYYAPKNNAGNVEFQKSTDSVKILSGSATITTSGTTVKAVSLSGKNNAVTIAGNDEGLAVSGTLKGGDLTFNGNVALSAGTFNNDGGNVTIANKTEIAEGSQIANTSGSIFVKSGTEIEGKLTVTGAGTIVLQNTKLWSTTNTTSVIITTSDFSGLIDTSAITKVAEVKQDISTSVIAKNQTFELVANTTVSSNLTVEGILIVDPGVTLTIEENAFVTMTDNMSQIINNGKIIVKAKAAGAGLFVNGGAFVNNGSVDFTAKSGAEGPYTFVVSSGAVKAVNNGSLTISKNDSADIAKFENNGNFTINGQIKSTGFANKGKVVINGATIDESATITIASTGASVNVSSMKLANATFTIENSDTSASSVALSTSGGEAVTVRGITVSGSKIYTANYLDVKGSMGVALPTTVPADATIAMNFANNIRVTDSFIVPKSVTLGFTTANFDVSGFMSVNKDAKVATGDLAADNLNLTVTGRVIDGYNRLSACTYVAAKYLNNDNSAVYTTLKDAIEEAELAEVLTVTIGAITIEDDIVIPQEMTVEAVNGSTQVKVGTSSKPVAIYVEQTGRFTAGDNNIILVNGSIYAEDSADVDKDTIVAHVVVEGEDDILFQSLNIALAGASAGDYIILSGQYVLTDSAVTIPAGVFVDATVNDNTDFVLIGSNMNVQGTLITDKFYFVADTNDNIGITVAGYMKDASVVPKCVPGHWFTPIGVSYEETTVDYNGDEVTYYVITSLDNLQAAVFAADDSKVTVEGKAKLGNVTIIGTEDQPAEVTFNDDVNAGTLTLDNAIIIAKPGKKVSASFADEYGAITIRGAYVGNKNLSIYSLGENGVYMTGPVTDSRDGVYSILFEGKTGMNNANIGWGNYTDNVAYPTITFAGDTLATGNKNVISNTADEPTNLMAGVVTVAGSLIADNGSKVSIVSDVDVLGTLAAKEAVAGTTNGTVEVAGNIFLGATKASVYDGDAAISAYLEDPKLADDQDYAEYGYQVTTTNGVATLAGKVVIDEGAADRFFITAVAGSAIEESIVDDMDSMDIIIDGVLWITVYGDKPYSMDGLKAPIVNSSVDSICDSEGTEIAKYSQKYGVIYGNEPMDLGITGDVYISLDYKIYTVLIKTDASIKAVYIDGVLTYTGMNQNQFYSYRVEAGTHTVSVEPATGYTADKAYLYTELGTLLKGLKFTFTQDDCIWDDDLSGYVAIYNVAGTEKIVDPEPLPPEQVSEWTVTTILLLVLVILIAIMAVIVALRLNRS